jgi:hypothetical protein
MIKPTLLEGDSLMSNREKDLNLNAIGAKAREINTSNDNIKDDCTLVSDIMINPTELGKFRFEMETPSGKIDVDALQSKGASFVYSGPVTMIKVTPHLKSRTIMINGLSIDLDISLRYTLKSNSMTVNLRSVGDTESNNGRWWIEIYATGAAIDPLPGELSKIENSDESTTKAPANICQNVGAQVASVDLFNLDVIDCLQGEPDDADAAILQSLNAKKICGSFSGPGTIEQKQNYPNSKNRSTTGGFLSEQQSKVSNTFLDVVAGIVSTMIKDEMQAGSRAAV